MPARRLIKPLWYGAAGLVVLFALLQAGGRLLLPRLPVQEDWVAQRVERLLKYPVDIGRVQLAWQGFGPVVRLQGARLLDPDSHQSLLAFDELDISIDPWPALLRGVLRPARLSARGLSLQLVRLADGRIRVRGMEHHPPARNPLLSLLVMPAVDLGDVHLAWHDRTGASPDFAFTFVRLRVRNRGGAHHFDLEGHPAGRSAQWLRLVARLQGPTPNPAGWSGRLFADLRGLTLEPGWFAALGSGWTLEGRVTGSCWLRLRQGTLQRLTATARLDQAVLRGADGRPWLRARRLGGDLRLDPLARGWRLRLDQMELATTSGTALDQALVAEFRPQADGLRIGLGLRGVALAPLPGLVPAAAPAPLAGWRRQLQDMAPQGLLTGDLWLARVPDGVRLLAYQGEVRQLRLAPVGRWPGGEVARVQLEGDARFGRVRVPGAALSLRLPHLFRGPLTLDRSQLSLRWWRLGKGLRVQVPAFDLANPDLHLRGHLVLAVPGTGASPYLDLYALFDHGRVEATPRYLPARVMPAKVVRWLDRALVHGRIDNGAMIFHGRLADFPFHGHQGRMEIRANLSDVILDYKAGWDRIEGLDAELVFIDDRMRILGADGKILGLDLVQADIRIADLARALLEVRGQVEGALPDMARFVEESPLAASQGRILHRLAFAGDARLDLGLRIPLSHLLKPGVAVDGRLHLVDDRVILLRRGLTLEKLSGEVDFDRHGVSARRLEARLWSTPVLISMRHLEAGGLARTRVELTGRLPLVARLRRSGRLWHNLSGRARWRVRLDVPAPDAESLGEVLVLTSDLRGIRVDAPPPLGKSAARAVPFRLRTELKPQGFGPLRIRYGPHAMVLALRHGAAGWRLERGELRFGGGPVRLPDGPGLHVTGRIEQVAFADWQDFIRRSLPSKPAGKTAVPGRGLGLPGRVDLDIGQAHLLGQTFSDLHLEALQYRSAWKVKARCADLEGQMQWPLAGSGDPLVMDLDEVHLSLPRAGNTTSAAGHSPRDWPPVRLHARHAVLGQLDLGQVDLVTRHLASGVEIQRLRVKADWLQLDANGRWEQLRRKQYSRFHVHARGPSLGRILERLGYTANLEQGPLETRLDANWRGAPWDFSLAGVEGSIEFHIGKGRLVDVDPGAGRVFGLLSLQALPRRLSLDFSDLFKKGFAFDSIDGRFSLIDANAYTEDLVIQGPAADIHIAGRVGLARRDYDELVTVAPHVRSSLPLAGAIAGGPAVGAALFLADKLLPRQMEALTRFTHYRYQVTGSWDDPHFERVKAPAPPGKDAEKDGP